MYLAIFSLYENNYRIEYNSIELITLYWYGSLTYWQALIIFILAFENTIINIKRR